MIQPSKWWIGLPPLAVLFTIAASLEIEKIEADIAGRARSALAGASQSLADASVAVQGRDVSLSGVAISRDAVAGIVAAIEKQEGVRVVFDKTAAPGLVKPFVFSLERRGKALTLAGFAPPGEAREQVSAAAAAKGLDVADRAGYALGAPADFGALANFALLLLDALGDGKVTLSDRSLAVTGAPATFDAYDRALAALESPPAGAIVGAVAIAPPRVTPFVWSAVKGGETVSLFGYAPSAEIRATLAGAAATRAEAPKVNDQSRVAGGAPAGFAGVATLALGALAELEQGKATLTDTSLSIEGAGKRNVAPVSVEATLRSALPRSFRLGEVKITAGVVSPFVFTARKEDGTLSLSGYAPAAATREALVGLVEKSFGGTVDDRLAVAAGAPAGFDRAATAALHALTRLRRGAAAISDRRVAIEGEAFTAAAAADIKARLGKQTPEAFETSARLGVAAPGEEIAPTELYATLAPTVAPGLYFGADNAALAEQSLPVADALAFLLQRSRGVALDIVGYFDGAGAASEAIARRRAEVVRDYLVASGVDSGRLTASGVGETPAEGEASRPRIEFLIK